MDVPRVGSSWVWDDKHGGVTSFTVLAVSEPNPTTWVTTVGLDGRPYQVDLENFYVTDEPCDGCARMIKGTPVVRVVTPKTGGTDG